MDTYTPAGGGSPPPTLNALLNRLLDEVEGGASAAPPPPASTGSAQEATPGAASAAASAAESAASPSGSGTSLLGGLLANPALLTALPTLAENLGPLLGSMSAGTGSAPAATRPHSINRPLRVDRHTALLCAVKPYLSPGRQNAAETVIRLCRVWDALERSGISLSGLFSSAGGASAGGVSSGGGSSGGQAVSVSAEQEEVT